MAFGLRSRSLGQVLGLWQQDQPKDPGLDPVEASWSSGLLGTDSSSDDPQT